MLCLAPPLGLEQQRDNLVALIEGHLVLEGAHVVADIELVHVRGRARHAGGRVDLSVGVAREAEDGADTAGRSDAHFADDADLIEEAMAPYGMDAFVHAHVDRDGRRRCFAFWHTGGR